MSIEPAKLIREARKNLEDKIGSSGD